VKEKKDRVEDAIYATKAALQEGIVPGGGVALLDASFAIIPENDGETILLEAIKAPYATIIDNAALAYYESGKTGIGIDVVANQQVNMIDSGIIDPVLVTKTALKNAVSVVNTIFSADCVINNVRVNNGSN
jgi:chaperonin GroEL